MDSDESEGKDWSDLEAEAQKGILNFTLCFFMEPVYHVIYAVF